jgi:hypothetical protein
MEMAADDDGLWFAASVETAPPSGSPILYFLGTGAAQPVVVQRGEYVNWVVAAGHTSWVNLCVNRTSRAANTETFTSPTAAPKLVRDAAATPVPTDIGEGPFDAAPVPFAGGIGLVAAVPGWIGDGAATTSDEKVVRLDPATGLSSSLVPSGAVPLLDLEANVVFDGSLYLLGAPDEPGEATLYRAQL